MRIRSPRRFRTACGLGLWLLGGGGAGEVVPMGAAHAQQAASPPAAPPQATAAAPLVVRGVTVIDVRTGQRVPNQTVVVVGTRIQALGRTGTVPTPKGARVVDARGQYLIPGLWDLHVHPFHYVDIAYRLFLANGVIGVRDAGSDVPLDTLSQWKWEIAAGIRVGPRLLVSGPSLFGIDPTLVADTTKVTRGTGQNSHILLVPAADAWRVVDSLHAAGADMLKLYMLPFAERVAMMAEARRLGMLLGGHSENMPGLTFSDSGATFLDHETWLPVCGDNGAEGHFDAAQCAAAAERLRHNNTWVTVQPVFSVLGGHNHGQMFLHLRRYRPTSFKAAWPVSDSDVATVREPASTADWAITSGKGNEDWNNSKRFARWHTAGIPMVVGADVMINDRAIGFLVPGFSVPQALVSFVLAGMTPLEALQTATLNPARALRATDSLGTVDAGKVADLVLLDADPLADIWNVSKIRAVVANGRYYDRAALDRLLLQAELEAARR